MSPRGPAMNASDDAALENPAHPTHCVCGRMFYSTGALRCIRCRAADAVGTGAAPPAGRPKHAPRIVIRRYPAPYPMPR